MSSDCISAVNTVINAFIGLCNGIENISGHITESIGIPLPIVTIIAAIVAFGIVGSLLFFGSKFAFKLYQEYCFNESSLLITLLSIAILVWCADIMPLNVVLMFILSLPLHIGVRWYIKGYKENH